MFHLDLFKTRTYTQVLWSSVVYTKDSSPEEMHNPLKACYVSMSFVSPYLLGRPTFLLPVGTYAYTNSVMCVSFILHPCYAPVHLQYKIISFKMCTFCSVTCSFLLLSYNVFRAMTSQISSLVVKPSYLFNYFLVSNYFCSNVLPSLKGHNFCSYSGNITVVCIINSI